ncbi:MAG: crotonase/enoyl-CoA hydratase family protein [Solirubrobacteraceae bacterium]
MSELTTYAAADGVATITLDDGKVNALSPAMLASIGERLDQAESEGAIVVLTGRATAFSAGFDLRTPPEGWPEMVEGGARLASRLLAFPQPTIASCNGSAVAMGAFLLLACDVRVGITGEHRIGLNEVAIGMTVPWFGIELARHRLAAPYFDRCTVTGPFLGPEEAQRAGFLDRLVEPDALRAATGEAACQLAGLDRAAHAATKLRTRGAALEAMADGVARFSDGRDW